MIDDANEIYMRGRVGAAKAAYEKADLRKRFSDEYDRGTQRALRARQSASQILALLQDFIPRNAMRDADEELLLAFFAQDVLLMNVPAEYDGLRELHLKAEMAKQMLKPFVVPPTPRE